MRPLPFGLAATPNLERWIRLTDDGQVVAFTGKVEIGQGLMTALRTIVAEELDVPPDRVQVVSAHTGVTPDEGTTAGSMSIETSGAALRQAAAWARRLLLERASKRLGVQVAELTVDDGRIAAPSINEIVDYWQLASEPFDFEIRERTAEKSPDEYRIGGGEGQRRSDVLAKATGAAFVHDATTDLHARVVRPPSIHHRLATLDAEVAPPGERVVDGSFVAVAHPQEFGAVRLAERVAGRARWTRLPSPAPDFEIDMARRNSAQALPLRDGRPTDTPAKRIETSHEACLRLHPRRPTLAWGTRCRPARGTVPGPTVRTVGAGSGARRGSRHPPQRVADLPVRRGRR